MALLTDNDVFGFDGYFKRIADLMVNLETLTDGWAQSTVASVNRIRASLDAAQKDLAPLREGIKSLGSVTRNGADQQISDYIQKISQVGQRVTVARQSLSILNEAQQLNGKVVSDLTARLATLVQRYQTLDDQSKDYQKQQRALTAEMKTVTRAIDAQSKSLQVGKSAIDAAEGSLNHLKQQTADLKKTLDAMPGAYDLSTKKINEQNRAAVALNDQYQKNIATLRKVEQGQQVFGRNVGNYPTQTQASGSSAASMALGVGSRLAGAGLAIAGVDSAIEAIKKVGDITLQFDSLDSALKVVSNDTALFTQRQTLLQRISDDLGQDLSVVEKNYTNLTASSKGTRLEGEATDKIFSSIVGTMGRLKRPAEDVDGALLAIGQMMSKGTVQSEELRGQLGERLPGAFNIAAHAMGVTTSKLSDMLKNGEVVASDFLPRFAAELEKTFNPNHERRVEGLSANLARFRNEAVEWVKSVNIGDTAGEWIGNMTRMAHSVREFFSPALQTANTRLADQTEVVKQLETQLPALLARYDELKAKSKLSTDEQRELKTVVNDLANLAPSAATGFDVYGNALDINKSKVMAFTQAQRELNAELNKSAIEALRVQTSSTMQLASEATARLNRGTKQESFGKPYFLMTDEEKRRATDKDPGKRREVPLTDEERKQQQADIQAQNRQIELGLTQRLQLGDKLDAASVAWIEHSGSAALKQYKLISDYNDKIAELTTRQASLLLKGDKESLKQREAILKEIKAYEDKKRAILSPSLTSAASGSDQPGQSEAAANKARIAEEKRLRDALSLAKSTSDRNLGKLNDDKQDGLLDEQTFIEQRLQITLKGLSERQVLLERANKKETDDYINVLREKEKAETEYKRSQLQLDLKTTKSQTGATVSALDVQHNEGGLSDLDYEEKRHKALQAGTTREMAILKEAGQEESELYKQAYQHQLDEQADYLKRKVKAEEKNWKEGLSEAKDALKQVNETVAAELENRLQELEKYYTQQENLIKLDVAKGTITPGEGDAKLYSLQMAHLKEQATAFEQSYAKDRQLSNSLLDDKIEQLKNYRDYAMLTDAEIEAANQQLRELEKVRGQEAAADKMKLDGKMADNGIAQDARETSEKLKNAEKAKKKRDALLQLGAEFATTLGDTAFSMMTSNNERESQALEKQHDNELKLAGDNADAKQRIDEQYNKRKAEIARKQAVQERDQALFSIALKTAMGVASVLSTGGGTYYADLGISAGLLTAFVIATGALEAAAVLSRPLPAYKYGKLETDNYTGLALGGEAGTELLVDRAGYSQLLTKPTVFQTKPGDRVYTAAETSALLGNWSKQQVADIAQQEISLNHQSADQLQLGRIQQQAAIYQLALQGSPSLTKQDMYEALGKALDERPVRETIFDEQGMRERERRGRNLTEYYKRRYGA
ncbi:tape measure protein [Spirosoma sp. HMF4905]|uniref:Tape measure protein n=1 Tax=Spirosoma arboris TaxID=2682092 RepID=A0A7K1SR20_9BACT|nr:tape measure protein [Spirosoma arboris]MVM36229.1 tape measure protein [Spirosoma arboris]